MIKSFQEFLEKAYLDEIATAIRGGQRHFVISFSELSKFDPALSEELLESPDDTLRAGEIAVENFESFGEIKGFKLRVSEMPESQKILIRNVRSNHIGKFISIMGIVRQKSDVRPLVTSARFECPSCGNILTVLQLDEKFKEPSRCGCGRKGKFRLVSKELVDAQKIVLEEAPEELEGSDQPKRLNVFLKNDLVSPISERTTNPGSKIIINGILKEVPIPAKDGGKLTRYDLMVEANFAQPVEEDFTQINISDEEKEEIMELSKDKKIYQKLINSFAPNIFGHDKIKEALVLQLFGGVRKVRESGSITRGDIHVLLVGDPGAGKSQLLKRASIVAPKSRFVSGKGASGAGLTATVVKDEFIRGWALEAGLLVLANKGLACLDEFDKMSKEDRSAMHEALEQQTVTISKANIQATLRSETSVLAAANPKFGRFDPYETVAKQIELPSTLINRFDLIFSIKDLPNKEIDDKLAGFVLKLHQNTDEEKADLETETLRKYFAYARQTSKPILSEDALLAIKDYYVKMRTSGMSEDGVVQSIPISPRQLEALVRLSEASAKIRLSKIVTKEDSQRAIGLLDYCLRQIGLDPETGKVDIDRIVSGVTASERSHISTIKEILRTLEKEFGDMIPLENILIAASEKKVSEDGVIEVIEKLKRSGDIFEPKRGQISRIK